MNIRTRILVPIDFSKESIYGLRTAQDMAKMSRGKIHLLHILDEPTSIEFNAYGDTTAREIAYQENLHYTAELIKRQTEHLHGLSLEYHDPDVPMDISVEPGLYKDGLKDFLKRYKIDLIVMGTTGETSISEFFSGNHTEQAMRIADVPVFAVKKYYSPQRFNKMVLGVNLIEYEEKPVRLIKRFAEIFNMKVLITHVKENKNVLVEEAMKKLNQFVRKHGFTKYSLIVTDKGKVDRKLEWVAREKNADIIATISEGRSGLVRLVFGSETEDIIEHAEKPVLVVSE